MTDEDFDAVLRRGIERALLASGFSRSLVADRCGLCVTRGEDAVTAAIRRGDWVRRMPDTWRPDVDSRWVHRYCLDLLLREIHQATGIEVIP